MVDYYDETGKSAKKFLVRKPVNNAIMRSGFGSRRHPILGYVKMHTGVDWATPYGTPIFASGNGVVETAGWEGGYGNYVKLKHNNGYETAYGHMSAFAKGLEVGKRVRQGQVIGFVGSTGQSTGSHVHYEILVNGRFVDPMRIKLPRGRSLDGADDGGLRKGTRPPGCPDEQPRRRCPRFRRHRHRQCAASQQSVTIPDIKFPRCLKLMPRPAGISFCCRNRSTGKFRLPNSRRGQILSESKREAAGLRWGWAVAQLLLRAPEYMVLGAATSSRFGLSFHPIGIFNR